MRPSPVQLSQVPPITSSFLPSSEQDHRLGPALFGKYGLGGRQAIVWNAAVLFGVTQALPDTNLRLQVEYEF